jgi:NAD(P)-dependent dehydrogenase (short-subunit alcohol dehydrogenase family)
MKRLEGKAAIVTGSGEGIGRGIARRLASRVSLAVGVLLASAACVAPVSGEALEEKLRQAGASVRGLGSDPSVFPITADSQMAAWTLAAESKDSGPLPLARQLNHRMDRASKRQRMLVVGGPYPSLTRKVVLDALVLVYVGSAESAREVRTAAGTLGIRFIQRELP